MRVRSICASTATDGEVCMVGFSQELRSRRVKYQNTLGGMHEEGGDSVRVCPRSACQHQRP